MTFLEEQKTKLKKWTKVTILFQSEQLDNVTSVVPTETEALTSFDAWLK